MLRQRAPWWMFVVAASFLAYVALVLYQAFWGPSGPAAIESDFRRGEMVVLGGQPNSAAQRAGLKAHDRVLAVDGQAVRNVHDLGAILANTEVGRPEQVEIVRGGQRLQLTLTFPREAWIGGQSPEGLAGSAYITVVLTSFILGVVISFSRPYDPIAVEPAWDLWALAVVVYEMLTGEKPFVGATGAEWQSAVLAGRFTPLSKHLPDVSARGQEFFARAFALEKDQRPNSARVFFSEFERALA